MEASLPEHKPPVSAKEGSSVTGKRPEWYRNGEQIISSWPGPRQLPGFTGLLRVVQTNHQLAASATRQAVVENAPRDIAA